MILRAPLDGVEALTDLRREEGAELLPHATESAVAWIRQQMASTAALDDGRWALFHALEGELSGTSGAEGIAIPLRAARTALDAGDVVAALREARLAVEEVVAAADWLDRATDDDPVDRRHSMRLLRELDRELLADNALTAVLALAPDRDPARATFARRSPRSRMPCSRARPSPRPAPSRMAVCGSPASVHWSGCSMACDGRRTTAGRSTSVPGSRRSAC